MAKKNAPVNLKPFGSSLGRVWEEKASEYFLVDHKWSINQPKKFQR